jgi:hypothetical protein
MIEKSNSWVASAKYGIHEHIEPNLSEYSFAMSSFSSESGTSSCAAVVLAAHKPLLDALHPLHDNFTNHKQVLASREEE